MQVFSNWTLSAALYTLLLCRCCYVNVFFFYSFFVLFQVCFWPLCCLSLFDIRILIIPLVSSNSSYYNIYNDLVSNCGRNMFQMKRVMVMRITAIFNNISVIYIVAVNFICGWNPITQRKTLICRKSLTNAII